MPLDSTIHDAYMAARNGLSRMVSRLVPPKEVEDIVQETYVRLCQVEQPRSISEPRSFLYRTAKNLALDHLKRAETRLTDSPEDSLDSMMLEQTVDNTLQSVVSDQEFGHFCEAVRQLPVVCRKVFVLKKVYGYSQKEIAKMMNISESTIEKHIAQGMKRSMLYVMQKEQGAPVPADKASVTGKSL
ncbi:RNA polymerase sigma factor [Planctobacterium marinum]|uniref:RNA polymerase sigma factor n=1 Tax=Planctobacterium marinum TaxID=1631968 RepID=UPI001E308818|nr:RNA polymerase sigma factor [Planctobacterium marinum]MCC2606909.1 RNA polymerase sigma factor [Planctobacterium marinum]